LVRSKHRATLADAVTAMAVAATTDLRGQEIVPDVVAIVSKAPDLVRYAKLLQQWQRSGSHRLDPHQDGPHPHAGAVALMDEWWTPLVHAMFDPQIGGLYDQVGVSFHDSPSNHLGSAFQGAFYGAVKKALDQARGRKVKGEYQALRCGGGPRKAC